jgi:sec-independent protein translocase protein TatB
MFDISWTEFLLIGVVALVVIGPKELPGVMRTMGQWTRKVRGMAGEFQNQFQEAMREAEMADLKKQVDDMASDIKNYDPLKEVRTDVETMGKDIEKSFVTDGETKTVTQQATEPQSSEQPSSALPPAADVQPAEPQALEQKAAEPLPTTAVIAEPLPVTPAPAHEPEPAAAEPASPERTG